MLSAEKYLKLGFRNCVKLGNNITGRRAFTFRKFYLFESSDCNF